MSRKIAIVIQRYGLEVNGGAEYHARLLAEHLSQRHEIEVLTSTALDYGTWANHYPAGKEMINGIQVNRFSTIPTSPKKARKARRAISKERKYFKILKKIGLFEMLDKMFHITRISHQEIESWITQQGPYCPELIQYIRIHQTRFDVFIFFTYLYYPTLKGMPLVGDKSIFIPTAHDEPLLYTIPYADIFASPKFIMYNTEVEKKLIESHFEDITSDTDVAGIGIEGGYKGKGEVLPDGLLPQKYFVYIGRIATDKGCEQMITYFIQFQERHPEYKAYKLVLVGKSYMKHTYDYPTVLYAGFVSEELKYTLLHHARAMIMPSFYESLSLVTLEAMYEGVPVLVNKSCEVLYTHILKSQTGASYDSLESFFLVLEQYILKSKKDLETEGQQAKQYVLDNYTWERVMEKFETSIHFVAKG